MRGVRLRLAEWLLRSAGPDGAYAGGRRYARKGNYEVGIAAFARAERQYAERLGPTNPGVIDAMAQRAWCLIALGRLREGEELYKKALAAKVGRLDDLPPRVEELHRLLADARLRLTLEEARSPEESK